MTGTAAKHDYSEAFFAGNACSRAHHTSSYDSMLPQACCHAALIETQ